MGPLQKTIFYLLETEVQFFNPTNYAKAKIHISPTDVNNARPTLLWVNVTREYNKESNTLMGANPSPRPIPLSQ